MKFLTDPVLPALLLVGYVAASAARVTLARLAFPYDVLIWAESPFMTNMLKLHGWSAIYGAPDAGNSFVYPPGLEMICWVLLRPLGKDLDVVWCRSVLALVGVGAAVLAGLVANRLRTGREKASGVAIVTGAAMAWLVLHQNFTSDVLHPDNLHAAHALGCLLLTLVALDTGSYRAATAAAIVAGVGVLTKQTEAASLAGVLVVLALRFGLRDRSAWRAAGWGIAVAAACALLLFAHGWGFFQLVTVLRKQPVHFDRLPELLQRLEMPRRAVLLLVGLGGVARLVQRGRGRAVAAWAILGVTCALPNVLAYVKEMGDWNNLGIFETWLFLPAWTALVDSAEAGVAGRVASTLCIGAMLLFLGTPKKPPPPRLLAHLGEAERRIAEDVQSGKKILVSHGTSWLIRAGVREPPLDRENSVLELAVAGLEDRAGTLGRIQSGVYDRIYVVNGWYPADVQRAIYARYGHDPALPPPEGGLTYADGYQVNFRAVEVWSRRP